MIAQPRSRSATEFRFGGTSGSERGQTTELFHHRFAANLARDRVDELRVVDRVAASAGGIDSERLGEAFNILETSASEERWVEQHIRPGDYS